MKVTVLMAFLCALLSGCGSDEPQPGLTGSQGKPHKQTVSTAGDSVRQGSSGTEGTSAVSLDFLASEVVSGSSAEVNVSGCSGRVTFTWSVNGAPVEGATGPRLAAGHFKRDDDVTVSVSCGGERETISATVLNGLPEVVRVNLQDPVIANGKEIVVEAEAIDPDGDEVGFDYQWFVNGEEVAIDGNRLPAALVRTGGQIDLTVVPSDFYGDGPPYSGKSLTVPNSPPHFVSQPPQSFRLEQYSYPAQAVDPDGDQIVYRVENGPPGLQVDAETGLVTWDLLAAEPGAYTVRIVAEDPAGLFSAQEFSFTLQSSE